jgi:2-C-methyl-D-erythritol 4-phosphate cytidylyltransferase/2-C-methyl-D-erythritol 2,4-cyclodiphosphate synthase
MLCGIAVPHDFGLVGHSDADVGLHALTDALLGAIGAADIGEHFPPTDPQWRGASSDRFVRHAVSLIHSRGGQVINADITLVCEAPKVKPHRQAMRERIAQMLNLPVEAVSVKATTTEGMGFTGRSEGLAAQAVVSVSLPA